MIHRVGRNRRGQSGRVGLPNEIARRVKDVTRRRAVWVGDGGVAIQVVKAIGGCQRGLVRRMNSIRRVFGFARAIVRFVVVKGVGDKHVVLRVVARFAREQVVAVKGICVCQMIPNDSKFLPEVQSLQFDGQYFARSSGESSMAFLSHPSASPPSATFHTLFSRLKSKTSLYACA